jgi:Zn-dependent protease
MAHELVLLTFYIATLIYSVIIHEVSHGVMALFLGDLTAKYAGRLNLNPLKHIDPFGSVILPVLLILTTGFAFGWAKPVPYNPYNLRAKKWGPVLVALSGPFSNFFLALLAALLASVLPLTLLQKRDIVLRFEGIVGGHQGIVEAFGLFADALSGSLPAIFFGLCLMIIFWNVILGCFNLLPFPPLDGSKLLYAIFPIPERTQMLLEQYGLILIFGVIFFFAYPIELFITTVLQFFIRVAV